MTYGDDSGEPQYPRQGYGQLPPQPQQYPHGQPWQPQQYDPAARHRRIQDPPQEAPWQQAPYPQQGSQPLLPGQPWQQPGYGQQPYMPPQPLRSKSWPARHKVLTGFLAFCGLVFVTGIAAAAVSPSSPTAASSTPAAPPTQTQAAAASPASATTPPAAVTPAGAHNSSGTVGSLKYMCYMGAMENEGQNFVSGAPYDNGYGTGYSALVEVTNISSAPVTVSKYALGVQPPGQESSLFSTLDNSAADLPQTIQPGQTGGWTMQDLPLDVGDHGTTCWLDSYT